MGLVVDLFAGGGGASIGIEAALGRAVDIAINHDPVALAVHKANHPATRHLEADIWEVKPREATGGAPVDVLWASPDCTHFSIAKGDVPRSKKIRSLAWAVTRWAKEARPAVIFLENVAEFRGWGPLGPDGKPDKSRMGFTFHRWRRQLENLGYRVDYRILDASAYGAPTRRRRLFLVARCDGQTIHWPEPTHGDGLFLEPVRTAAECIDWSLACPSIFERKRPLAEKTLWRIAEGIRRFVLESPEPFLVQVNHGRREARSESIAAPLSTITATQRGHALVTPIFVEPGQRHGRGNRDGSEPLSTVVTKDRHAIVAPTLIQTGYGERRGQAARVPGLDKPLGTMVNGQKHALVAAFLAKHFGGVVGQALDRPASTVTGRDHHSLAAATLMPSDHDGGGSHAQEVRAFLTTYYGSGSVGQPAGRPLRTITAKHRLGLVTVHGVDYQIVDIGMRMLEPHELLAAQFGRFADGYDLSAARTKSAKVRLIGNSVCPEVAEAIVRANVTAATEQEATA